MDPRRDGVEEGVGASALFASTRRCRRRIACSTKSTGMSSSSIENEHKRGDKQTDKIDTDRHTQLYMIIHTEQHTGFDMETPAYSLVVCVFSVRELSCVRVVLPHTHHLDMTHAEVSREAQRHRGDKNNNKNSARPLVFVVGAAGLILLTLRVVGRCSIETSLVSR